MEFFILDHCVRIAEYAYEVIQDGATNLPLDFGVLRSPIETSITAANLVDGELIKIEKIEAKCEDAIVVALHKIPHGKYALMFFDNRSAHL